MLIISHGSLIIQAEAEIRLWPRGIDGVHSPKTASESSSHDSLLTSKESDNRWQLERGQLGPRSLLHNEGVTVHTNDEILREDGCC